ncbi:hypothetical protein [Zavarzinia sp.]|uniref:hypothetical protein n=1 Tax=Zavarzinia sp. TaxID=2027920 RepID=UPI003BB6265E
MLADLQDIVGDLVRDAVSRLGDAARDRAIGLAVVQYGKDRPRVIVEDLVSAAGTPKTLPLPADWLQGQSRALSIEYPIGEVPTSLLPRHLWTVATVPTGEIIALPAEAVTGAAHRLAWCRPHVVSAFEDSIPDQDREAVAQYAAGLLLDQLATLTSGDRESTIKGDSVDHGEAAPNYAARAKTARQRYHDLLGIDPKRLQPASVTVNPPLVSSKGEGRLLWRRKRS